MFVNSENYTPVAQRRWKRYSIDAKVKVLSVRNKIRMMSFGRLDNLSEGGLAFACPHELAMDERVELEFELPHARIAAKLSGLVRHNGGIYGVEFCDLWTRQRQELMRACTNLSRQKI